MSSCRMDIAGITIRLVLPAILLAACLQTAWANETNKKKSPQHFFSVEYVATYDKTYKNDILRFQYRDDNWTLKYDMNPEDQDEYCIDFNAIDTEKNKLVISHLGSIEETIDGKLLPRIYDFSLCYTRYIGTLPLLGKSSIKLYSYSSIKRKENIEQKYRIGLLTSHLEFIYQYRLDETRTPHANYYGYYHNSFWALSIGRAPEQRINATLVLKKPPIKSVAVFDYYIDTETFQVYAFNALKNGDTDFYHEAMADVSAWLVILGDKGVNMFYVPTFLAFGDISQSILYKESPEEVYIANQLGVRIAKRIGFGGGILMKKLKPGSFTLSPIISAYLKIPIGKQYIHLDTRYEDKVLNFYVYMRFSF